MLTLALLALIPLSIGDGSGDGSGGAALIVDAGGAEIAASISVPDESSEGASEDDESTCRWEPAVIYGLPVVDIDLVGDGVLRRNHPVFGHRQYGMREVCEGATGRFAWVDERPPTTAGAGAPFRARRCGVRQPRLLARHRTGRVGDRIGRRRRAPRPGDGEPDLGAVLMGQRGRHLRSGNSE